MTISTSTCGAIVREYDRQGWHRTGTDVDGRSAAWLVEELAARGAVARLTSFPFERVDADPCLVSTGDREVMGYPLPDGLLPPAGGIITALLGTAPDPERIALVRVDQHGRSALLDTMRDEGWKAVIAAVEGTPHGLTLRNAWDYDNPSGPPIIQVPAAAWDWLTAARADGTGITIRCGASRVEVDAQNVVATVPGRWPELPPVVVLTPRSGWWHCAGERGGGIAIWLEVAREVRELELSREVVFLATTGHELGFLGIRKHLEGEPDLARRASLWIHLGANIGALEAPTVVRAADQDLIGMVRQVDESAPGTPVRPTCEVVKQPTGGEAAVVAAAGGRYVSLVGRGFPLFHSTEDRWPGAIDEEAIAANAALVLGLIRALEPSA